jgi:hypothetical protein
MRSNCASWLMAGLVMTLAASTVRAQGPPGMFPPQGGMGGPGGMFGAPSMIASEAVQEDLGLSDKQKAQIKKLQASMLQRTRETFLAARENGVDPQEVMQEMSSLARDNNAAITRVLDKNQKARLAQIELQRDGLLALARADVAGKVKLTSTQTRKIKTIVDEMRQAQARSMPAPPGFGGPPADGIAAAPKVAAVPKSKGANAKGRRTPQGGNAAPGGEDTPPGGEGFPGGGPPGFGNLNGGPPGGMPDFNSEEFKAQFARMMEANKKIRETATDKIGEVLTPEQKQAFDKLIGKPFDFSKAQPGPPPGADTPKAEEEATKKEAPAKSQSKTRSRKSANH